MTQDEARKELLKLRRQWRTEATRQRKLAKSHSDAAERERALGGVDVYEMCANDIDGLIWELRADDN
jgi:hypothetical protein